MKISTIMAVIVLAALGLAMSAEVAQAQEHDVTFRVRSYDRYAVDVRFFSTSGRRKGTTWPGGDRAYSLRDSEVHDFKLRCYHHEYICYGAWVAGNPRRYWGLGADGRQRCENCCWYCDNEYTQVITLQPY